MASSNKKPKRKVGRPPKQQYFSADELQKQAVERLRKSAEQRTQYKQLDVDEFISDVDRLNRKRKLTEEEILDIRTKVDLLYHQYVEQKHIDEAAITEPFAPTLRALALEGKAAPIKCMSVEEWREAHGLRKDGKGLKPGPAKKKPKTIYDVELQEDNSELPDYEQLETQWMEHRMEQMKHEPNFPVGKRLRDDKELGSARIQQAKNFWV